MSDFATIFDLPLETQGRQTLLQTAWMGGAFVTVPHFLGRILKHNLFRENQVVVAQKLRQYFVSRGWTDSTPLASNKSSWEFLGSLLEHYVQPRQTDAAAQRNFLAIEAFLRHPHLLNAEIALEIETTERQVARNSNLAYLRRLLAESLADELQS